MSIADRVRTAIERVKQKDYESAFVAVWPAVDATAKKCSEALQVGDRIKGFLHENLLLITKVAFGPGFKSVRVRYPHPLLIEKKILAADGTCSIEEVLYHIVRCSLIHEAGLPPELKLSHERMFALKDGVLTIPGSLVQGLIAAVLFCPENADERLGVDYGFLIGQFQAPVDELWGKKQDLMDLYTSMERLLGKGRAGERAAGEERRVP